MMMGSQQERRVRAGSAGGSAGEAGSSFRSGVAAYAAAHILRGQPFVDLELSRDFAMPVSMLLEADVAVDDLVVELTGGGSAYIQAKTTLNFGRTAESSMASVVGQWIELVAEKRLDRERDRLVAAAVRGSGSVRDLRNALRRRRRPLAGALSLGEQTALQKVTTLLDVLDEPTQSDVLDCAVVWFADLEETDGLSARLGQALLEPGVVARDQGLRAWNVLRESARELARQRYGATLQDLMARLADEGLTLTADGEGYASAQREERRLLVSAYRERVARRGETLDFRGLGAPIPALSLAEVDAGVGVYPLAGGGSPGGTELHGADLLWALRRRGRAILVGLPGSGKSVALRAAAAGYARRATWPIPVVVPLDRLARVQRTMGFEEALLEAALQDEPVTARPHLRVAVIDAIRAGSAAIFFDALDETRSLRHQIMASLEAGIGDMSPSIEVLLTTRDVAYADAQTLGFPELRVLPPEEPMDTVRAILRAVTTERGLSARDSEKWINERERWIGGRLGADSSLRETPLMVVLLTMLAAEGELADLPLDRAHVLARVLDDVVVRWDAGLRLQGGRPRLGSLEDRDATNAARSAFVAIGHEVFETGDPLRGGVLDHLRDELREAFGLTRDRARSVADDALELWDEAGVFVISGTSGRMQARLRLFAELAEATRILRQEPHRQRAWTEAAIWREDAHEVVLLAAGLSPVVADELLAAAAAHPDEAPLLEFVVEAARQQVSISESSLRDLVDAVTRLELSDDNELLRVALALLDLPIGHADIPRVLDFFNRLSSARRIVVRAISVGSWDRDDPAAGADLQAMMDIEPTARIAFPIEHRAFVDPLYQRAVLVVADRIEQAGGADIARWLAERIRKGVTIGAIHTIRRQLEAHGFAALMEEVDGPPARVGLPDPWGHIVAGHAEIEDRFLQLVEALGAPEELSRVQARRLDSLADLVTTSDFGNAPEYEVSAALERAPDQVKVSLGAAALLGGLELGVVAAQALQVRQEIATESQPGMPFHMLWDQAQKLQLRDWSRIAEPVPTATALASAMLCNSPWIGELALGCLDTAPRAARDAAFAVLDAGLDQARGRTQWLVSIGRLALAGDSDLLEREESDSRPMVRRAVATMHSWGPPSPQAKAALLKLLRDADRGVREETIRAVGTVGLGTELARAAQGDC